MTTIGFLHTAEVHSATFGALLSGLAPQAAQEHLVDTTLLADARRRGGIDADLRSRLEERLRQLCGRGADVVICTCSTLGAAAESIELDVPLVRGDRPMAERAVATGRRIAIVATVESTLAPTRELLEECARAAGTAPEVIDALCADAWPLFETGDQAGYLARVAEHIKSLPPDIDVVVLPQPSLAGVVDLLPGLTVLSSPRPVVLAALRVLEP